MACYRYLRLDERQRIQRMWEAGNTVKEIAEQLKVPLSTMYAEIKRGQDQKTRLPDQRLKYDAELAQLTVQRSFERRGRKAAGALTR